MKLIPLYLTALSLNISPFAYADITGEDKKNIEQIVREYLLDNPEILYEMQDVLIKKETLAQEKNLSDSLTVIFKNKNVPTLGNIKDPKVTLTEFMDYSCYYCRQMWPELKKLIDKYPELQIKIINLPILGESSEWLANYSLSFWQLHPEKWEEFHNKILTAKNNFSEEAIKNLVKSLEGDWDKLSQMVTDNTAFDTLHQGVKLAKDAGIQGTPFYAVGTEDFFPGAVSYKQLSKAIEAYLKK